MTLFKNKYRIETTRLQHWDYTSDGRYFITICTRNRVKFLGKIVNGKMILNEYGRIVEHCWFDLINHYLNLRLDAFVIMPNHIHGIMIIDNSHQKNNTHGNERYGMDKWDGMNKWDGMDKRDGMEIRDGMNKWDGMEIRDGMLETGFKPVSTDPDPVPQPNPTSTPLDSKQPQSRHGIFEFVRALKSFSSRRMNEMDNTPGVTRWQSRFHDHIIRNEQEFHRIQKYIINNPINWANDSFKMEKKKT